jgi:hypothetical protein
MKTMFSVSQKFRVHQYWTQVSGRWDRRKGDKAMAEKRLLRKIDELASMLDGDVVEQFNRYVLSIHLGW